MRLIDADALVEEIVNIDDLRRLSTATIGRALNAVPTVDAIPMEWLRQYAPEKWSMYMQAAVEIIIEAWQKEQEVR